MSVRLNRVTEQWGRPSQSDAFGDVYGNNDFLVLAPWKEFCFSSYCASGESSGRGIASWRGGAHTIQYSRVPTGLETVIATAFTGSILIVVSTPITYAPTCPKEANCREADGAQEAYANRISKADAGGFPLAAPPTSLNGSLSVWTGQELIVFGFTTKGTDGSVYLNGTRLAP